VWKEHEGNIPLRLPQDGMRFWLTFLPEEERTLRPDGIHLFGLRYWSPALSADLGRSKRRLLVKFDPRDMSRVFVRRPSGPEMLRMLRGHTMGDNRARFGDCAENMIARARRPRACSQMQLI
jgi:hypothetical protein